jgi:hypothetical protein
MELEVKDLTTDRQKYKTRVKSYQVELTKLETDVVCNSLFSKPPWGFGGFKQPTSETFGPDDTTQVDRYPIYKQIQSLASDYQSRLNNVKNVIKEKRE